MEHGTVSSPFKEALGALTLARFLIPLDIIDAGIILCCSGILCHVGLNYSQPTLKQYKEKNVITRRLFPEIILNLIKNHTVFIFGNRSYSIIV